MDSSGKRQATRKRIRGRSDFAAFDDIALYSDALTGAEVSLEISRHGTERVLMLRVLSAWARAVGPHLKTVARPATCRLGRMTVEVRDNGWKRELERVRPEILARMTRLLPDHPINEISFRLKATMPAVLSVPSGGPNTVAKPAVDRLRPVEDHPAAATARGGQRDRDEDLRNQLQQVMGRYLARSH